MDTVRIARDLGDVSAIFPEGIDDIRDLPYTYFDAIRIALGFLTFDELPDDERPPRSIWMEGDLMQAHWKAVKKARDAKYGDGDIRDEEIEGPVSQNDTEALLGMKR